MKDKIYVPIPREENQQELSDRREDYASKRDLMASEYNEAINKRLKTETRNLKKCSNCGKEFSAQVPDSAELICPECAKETR